MKQIQKIYAKEKAKHKEEKTYVVSSRFNSVQGRKAGRNIKMVDSRLKKDLRSQVKGKKAKAKGKGKGRK